MNTAAGVVWRAHRKKWGNPEITHIVYSSSNPCL